MDTDIKIKRQLVQMYKQVRFRIEYRHRKIMGGGEGNEKIYQYLISDQPCMIGRLGATEARCVEKWLNHKKYTAKNIYNISNLSGFFPTEERYIDEFCKCYTESIKATDLMAVWQVTGEKQIIDKYCPNASLTYIKALEPYYFENPWSRCLEGKKVLIVHPFVESIKKQLDHNREKLFTNKRILPRMNVSYVKAVQSNAGNDVEFNTWFEALEEMKRQIKSKNFEIAIVGAGAYGMPLAAYIKKLGKKSILMAGATQILFGIKGKRWDNNLEVASLYNKYWIRPSKNETPREKERVEGGSYW